MIRYFILAISFIIWFYCQPLNGQSFDVRHYTTIDGLPRNYTTGLLFDKNGYLWLGSEPGISRFNGRSFYNFPYVSEATFAAADALFQDDNGNLWIGARDGVHRLKDFHTIERVELDSTITARYILNIFKWQNEIYAMSKELMKFDGKKFTKVPFIGGLQTVVGYANTADPSVILAHNLAGIYAISKSGTRLLHPLKDQKLPYFCCKVHNRKTYYEFFDKIYQFPEKAVVYTHPLDENISNFNFDKKGNIWLISNNQSVQCQYDGKFHNISTELNLPFILYHVIALDAENNAWVTGDALLKISPKIVTNLTTNQNSSKLSNLERIKNDYNFSLQSVEKFKKDRSTIVKNFKKEDKTIVSYDYDQQSNKYLLVSDSTLCILDSNDREVLRKKLPDNYLSIAFHPVDHCLYLAGDYVSIFDVHNFQLRKFTDNTKQYNIKTLHQIKDKVIGQSSQTLFLLDQGKIKDLKVNHQLKKITQVVLNDKDLYLISLRSGIKRYAMNPDFSLRFEADVVIEPKSVLGFDKLRFNDRKSFVASGAQALYYGVLTNDTINTLNLCLDYDIYPNINGKYGIMKKQQDAFFVSNFNGIQTLNTSYFVSHPPSVTITKVSSQTGKEVYYAYHPKDLKYPDLELDHNQNSLKIDFDAPNFTHNNQGYFQYELYRNGELITNSRSKEHFTNLSGLAAGTYLFTLTFVNYLGEKSPYVNLTINIHPPFYLTIWFIIAMVILIGTLFIWVINRYYENKERKIVESKLLQNKMSELQIMALQSQMNPHFIFNSLNSIQDFVLSKEPLEAVKYLAKFSKLIRQILDNSSHYLLSLEKITSTLENYLELENMRLDNQLQYKIEVDPKIAEMDVNLPIMTIQPHIENAIWHGLSTKKSSKNIWVRFLIDPQDQTLVCEIEDNGVGRSTVKNKEGHTSRGTSILNQMLEVIGDLSETAVVQKVIDLQDGGVPTGTKVVINFPFIKIN